MYKIKAGLVTVEGERFGCVVEVRTGIENFIHLANGDCYNECEVDNLVILESELNIDIIQLCQKIEKERLGGISNG